ncbi:MAG: structural protein [Patescibacteria group bacterium]|nr:structural protein [Patescibacteria group bacterium]
MNETRGERNNNPGNLEKNNIHWKGLALNETGDTRFCVFETPEDGIRALARTVLNYQRIHQLDTIEDIINRWAPPTENQTEAYVNAVCGDVGIPADHRVDLEDPRTLARIVQAIIKHENGRCVYDVKLIARAVDSALSV